MPKGTRVPGPGHIHLEVGAPLPPPGAPARAGCPGAGSTC